MKICTRLMFALGVLVLAAGLYLWRYPPVDPTELLIADSKCTFDSLPVGETEAIFRVTNPTSKPVRIIGLQEG